MMKKSYKSVLFVLSCFFCNPAFAGRWINWGAIVEDIQDGIMTVVDFVSDKISTKWVKIVASGTIITKEVPLHKVDSIDVIGAGTAVVTQDNKQEGLLVIETDEALMPYIEAEVVGNKLIVKTKENISYSLDNKNLVYNIRIKDLTHVALTGAVSGAINAIATKSLLLDVAGAARLSGDIIVDSLVVKSAGASRVVISGKAAMQNFDISGSCKVDCRNVEGKSVVVHVAGASVAYCNASDILSGYVSGVSSLYYANNPTVSVKSSTMATVQKL